MEKKNFHKLMAYFGVALSATLGINLYAVTAEGTPTYLIVTSICLMLTALAGAVYIFTGYTKKRSAGAFSLFMIMYAVSELVGVLGLRDESTVGLFLLSFAFGFALVIGLGKDLGKVTSIVLSSLIVASTAARLIMSCFSETVTSSLIVLISKIILGISVLIIVIAKYYDKAMRKS